jgi:hypothetical protein
MGRMDATHGGWHWNRAINNDLLIGLIPDPSESIVAYEQLKDSQ